ncbi:MAG: anthranilate phosphoribosyltransferase, partial [Planctomycetes bacterium]|nr:anthranilate phosphoribosyltransferase [Planctomycetota bacterium]
MSDNQVPSIAPLLSIVADGQALSRQQARDAMSALLSGEATPVQIAAFLLALRVRGETVEEITGLVEGMREASVRIDPAREGMVARCGTGGDGSGTFNISTAAALVVAGCGVPVAKHGNRSASSLCGSADVLEELGVPLDLEPQEARRMIEETGFAFLFAQ